jgi:inhibitor of the pro-sigma K processing machinery
MQLNQAVILMTAMCFIVLAIVLAKNKLEFIINIVLRMVSGVVCIHFLNSLFVTMGINLLVGINPGTIGTIGVLGIPGFLLVYAVSIFNLV